MPINGPTINVLSKWNVAFTWTPNAAAYPAKGPCFLNLHATGAADALKKAQDQTAMQAGIAPVTYGTPMPGWVDQ